MANFREYLQRQEVTNDPMGDFINDVNLCVERYGTTHSRIRLPFNEHYEHHPKAFPSDWEHGWDYYEKYLIQFTQNEDIIEVGHKWWKKFVKDCNVKERKSSD